MAETLVLRAGFRERVVRFVVTLVGLLILRAVLEALPMLKNASAIDDSLLSPLVIAKAVVDTLILAVALSFGTGVGRSVRESNWKLPDLGTILSLATLAIVLGIAYSAYQVPVACVVFSPTDLFKASVTPAAADDAIRKLVIDWAGIQSAYQQLAGQQLKLLTGDSLAALQQLAAVRLTQPPDIYGWAFLILIAAPIVGIGVLVSRNLDSWTELLFHKATAAPGTSNTTGRTGARGLSSEDFEKLTKLKSLLDSGAISSEDFETQKKKILAPDTQVAPPTAEPDELRKLKALLDTGALTKEEYEAQKQRFLAQF